ncbi:mitochondrial cyclin box fold domain-containing protein [Andalucia godoyi]|uniref:Mitochondrial cyclin box fold domain-containing protein n=1 Tax=Andalucia godoyi TaxID=505711 RepID=A0A8K0AGH4_ANDGO|nr:mitochondrial cyclin box fold domain-containing protein [Andalucia godoyi]|eukprot:ANDGO_00093.mRNA.1 mitochondrial cyclin box fold domain-containing protein
MTRKALAFLTGISLSSRRTVAPRSDAAFASASGSRADSALSSIGSTANNSMSNVFANPSTVLVVAGATLEGQGAATNSGSTQPPQSSNGLRPHGYYNSSGLSNITVPYHATDVMDTNDAYQVSEVSDSVDAARSLSFAVQPYRVALPGFLSTTIPYATARESFHDVHRRGSRHGDPPSLVALGANRSQFFRHANTMPNLLSSQTGDESAVSHSNAGAFSQFGKMLLLPVHSSAYPAQFMAEGTPLTSTVANVGRRSRTRGHSYADTLSSALKDFIPVPYTSDVFDSPESIRSTSFVAPPHRIALPGFLSTIVPYVSPRDAKDTMNELFRRRCSELGITMNPAMTYSKIRKLRLELFTLCKHLDIEIATLATAFIYLDLCLIRAAITKSNRKVMALACLAIAIKFADPRFRDRTLYKTLLDEADERMGVKRKTVLDAEWVVFADVLKFELSIATIHAESMFRKIFADGYWGLQIGEYFAQRPGYRPATQKKVSLDIQIS